MCPQTASSEQLHNANSERLIETLHPIQESAQTAYIYI